MAKINYDIQTLESGERVELFELDATGIGGDLLRFHGHTQVGPIWWQGNEYSPWPIQGDGFARTGEGQQPTPTLSVGNVTGAITAMCLYLQDMVGAKLTRHVTLGKYLDAANFPGGNPTADPTEELPPEVWYLEQKTEEDNVAVTWELASALDFDGVQLPRRQIVANVCSWLSIGGYRGPYCGYTGTAYFDKDDNPVADPALDRCGGRLTSCKCRFGENNPLPFGSFPAADLIRS
ncbi:tail protein [Cupriavidus sp. HPC(L)]|uniref:phage minor tail protein L n=1 Tax=Cupriavidus sp. HPC(L) TaxID=1217418 RepID=UPI0002917869|nr:phage minor tail protein L [Cupriavidus sp. HPC(L)]ESH90797.1 tail protein [Cupriavidus sp. HPC(L)]